jgi:hypothetical protein
VIDRVQVLAQHLSRYSDSMTLWDPGDCQRNAIALFGVAPTWLHETDETGSSPTNMGGAEMSLEEEGPAGSFVGERLKQAGP